MNIMLVMRVQPYQRTNFKGTAPNVNELIKGVNQALAKKSSEQMKTILEGRLSIIDTLRECYPPGDILEIQRLGGIAQDVAVANSGHPRHAICVTARPL